MKQRLIVILLGLFFVGRIYLSAQMFDQSVVNTLQNCIQHQQYDRADSIIKFFRGKDLPETSIFWLNFIHSDVGVSKYIQSSDAKVYIPYMQSGIDAFTFLSQYINKDNAANSINCWNFLFYWSKIYAQLNNAIIDSISVFSDKYYNDYGQKNPKIYSLIQRIIYNYYFDHKDWMKCIDIMSKVERAFRNDSLNLEQSANACFDLGLAYLYMKDIKSSEKWCLSAYRCFQEISNKEQDMTYGQLLYILSTIYHQYIGDAEKTYIYSVEAERINKKLYGERAKMYVTTLAFLSDSEFILNKTQDGLKHLENIVALIDNVSDMEMMEKQMYRDKLKLIYLRFNIKKDVASKDTIVTENSIILEANDAFMRGDWETSISKFSFLLNYYETNFQAVYVETYIYIVASLSNALVYSGNYTKADSVLTHAITLIQNTNYSPLSFKDLYVSKGLLYHTINNFDMALHWYNISKDMYKEEEKKGIKYAALLSNISLCYVAKKDYSTAKHILEEAYNLCTQFYGKYAGHTNDRLIMLNNLATVYAKLKDYSKGKELYECVIDEATSQQNVGIKALALINLSEIFILYENDFPKAEEYLREAVKMDAASYVKDMAEADLLLIQILQRRETAVKGIERYNNRIKEELASMYAHFSEVEREEYWTQKSQILVLLNNLSAMTFNNPPNIKMAYDNTIYTKSMLINSGRLLGQLVNNSDSGIQNEYSSMVNMKRMLSNKNCPNDSINVYRDAISKKEKTIVASIPDFGSKLMAQFKTCDDVQGILSNNDIAIEFIFLPQIKKPFDRPELSYGAMLLTKSDTIPKLIPLCSEYDLEDLMDAYTPMGQNEVDSLYAFSNTTLYHMIWEKLEPYIPIGSTVYYSPIGYISKINLSALSNGEKRLSEVYDFYEVSTTAMIDEIKRSAGIDFHNAALYGDINYYEDIDLMKKKARTYSMYTSGEILATRSLSRGAWDLLPGTKEEIGTIAEMLRGKGTNVYMLTQNDANEESFKGFDTHAPELMHIATHGFYFPSGEDVTSSFFNGLHSYTQKDNSMLFSGLLFAGGNNAWTGKEIVEGVEDGILTADEISRIDLSGNKLIVLSACNTGLGDIDNVDGVFGLQRGLKRAGVKTILMSLWKVPDEETKELMRMFYKELLNGKTPHQSLKIAQKHLKAKGKSPYYWAGFILLD